ncbi:MAG: ATP-binding protein [Caldisericia bacterium]|nr:ATP-binding protein [Caldisericia bacterium]
MFIDREQELDYLEKSYRKEESQFIVIYGKRRVGKTELIKQFIKNKPHIYFLAQKISEYDNLKILGRLVGDFFNDKILKISGFLNWQLFFEYLNDKIKNKIIIVIDEFPYLAEINKGISSIFQAGWDEYLKQKPIFLILCGSSIGMMEKEILYYKAPLYGRRTGQIFLKPFDFYNSSKFYPNLSFDEKINFYSITGGNPSYLLKFNEKKSLKENIKENLLTPQSELYNEVEFILREELREPRNYFSIIKAISLGKTKISEIINETGFQKSIIHKYLFVLEDLQIIKKEIPVTEKNPLKSRKGIYKIEDQFFKFWFRYILPNKSLIEEGEIEKVLNLILDDFNIFVSEVYESVAIDILKSYKYLFFDFDKIGKWWDKNEEIDIVAFSEKENKILFGEVKWTNKPIGINIFEELKRKSRLVDWNINKRLEYFCIFSKSGFTDELIKIAKKEKIFLFHKDNLI